MQSPLLSLAILLTCAFACAFAGTWYIRKLALQKGVMDIPNARSSHVMPTPRGGGLAIVLVFCVFLALFGGGHAVEYSLVLAAILTGAIGMADDVKGMSAKQRSLVHLASASVVVYAVGGLPPIDFGFGPVNLGIAGYAVAVIGAVWMINLTNFMDGIDALVASQCVVASSIAMMLLLSTGMPAELLLATALLAACTLGFLLLNFPPARIFMGDVGSGTLGLIVSGLMLWHTQFDAKWLYVWLILMGILVVDASFTLGRRALSGKKLSHAHRSHAYQKLALRWQSHLAVTSLSGLISVVWLAPLAALVANGLINGFWAMVIAYLPLTAICIAMKAGVDAPPKP